MSITESFILVMSLQGESVMLMVLKPFGVTLKRRLSKFNGMNSEKFILHLKESEFRSNNRENDLYQILLKLIRKNPLN